MKGCDAESNAEPVRRDQPLVRGKDGRLALVLRRIRLHSPSEIGRGRLLAEPLPGQFTASLEIVFAAERKPEQRGD